MGVVFTVEATWKPKPKHELGGSRFIFNAVRSSSVLDYTLALDCVRDGIRRLSLRRVVSSVLLSTDYKHPEQWPIFTVLRTLTSFFVRTVAQAATATFTYVSRWSDPTDWPFNEPPISTDQTWIPPGRFACRTAKLVA